MSEQPTRRTTRQRTAVLELLAQNDQFRTAQQLHDALRDAGTPIGLATVYRCVQALAEAGEVDTMRTPEGETAYRRCAASDHHHHLVCRSCGRTVEISAASVESWVQGVSREHGFSEVSHHIELTGVCSSCC